MTLETQKCSEDPEHAWAKYVQNIKFKAEILLAGQLGTTLYQHRMKYAT